MSDGCKPVASVIFRVSSKTSLHSLFNIGDNLCCAINSSNTGRYRLPETLIVTVVDSHLVRSIDMNTERGVSYVLRTPSVLEITALIDFDKNVALPLRDVLKNEVFENPALYEEIPLAQEGEMRLWNALVQAAKKSRTIYLMMEMTTGLKQVG